MKSFCDSNTSTSSWMRNSAYFEFHVHSSFYARPLLLFFPKTKKKNVVTEKVTRINDQELEMMRVLLIIARSQLLIFLKMTLFFSGYRTPNEISLSLGRQRHVGRWDRAIDLLSVSHVFTVHTIRKLSSTNLLCASRSVPGSSSYQRVSNPKIN